MSHPRTRLTLLCLALQMAYQPAWSDTTADAANSLPVYLCQFGDTARLYAFKQNADGQWAGLGQLQGWSVSEQDGGMVARNLNDVLILSNGSASLLQGGRLERGQCVDPSNEMIQLFQPQDPAQGVPADTGQAQQIPNPPADSSTDLTSRRAFPDAGDILSALDPGNWDAAKVAAIIDALNLDSSERDSLKARLREAAQDPAQIARVARQIREVFGIEIAAAADLRAKLRDTRQNLAAAEQALQEQRQKTRETSALLTQAMNRAGAAEHANQLLARQLAALQAQLDAVTAQDKKLRSDLSAVLVELAVGRANLALANKRIIKLGGVPVRQ